MTKKFFFALVAVVGMALQCVAQDAVTLKLPKWSKFVRVNAEGVNLRKSPSTSSPRLMKVNVHSSYDYYHGVYNPMVSWNQNEKDGSPFRYEKETICPVVDETSDWYRIYVKPGIEAYIMKKFCTVESAQTVDSEYIAEITIKGDRKYLVNFSNGSASRAGFAEFGHQYGKALVWLDYGENGYKLCDKFSEGELLDRFLEDVRVIPQNQIVAFLSKNKPNKEYRVEYWFKATHNSWVINANEYKYEAETITFR